jgi:hypothetical protein
MRYAGKYSFVPSIHSVSGAKYAYLIKEYHAIFEKVILVGQKELSDKEKIELWNGIIQVSEYIACGFNYIVKTNYDKKTPKSKAVTAMFFRLCAIFGSSEYYEKIESVISDLAQNAVLYSLGMDSYKNNKAFVWKKDKTNGFSTIVKHATEVVFMQLCYDFLSTEIQAIDAISESPEDFIEIGVQDSLSAEEMIEKAGLTNRIPSSIEKAVIDYLDHGETENMKAIQPYLDVIYKRLHLRGD